jgi:[acyl-carrier-protein] S-malonyltransferase
MTRNRTALAFEGQGGDTSRMAEAFSKECALCLSLLAEADAAIGFPLSKVILEGSPDDLRRTAIAQPALVVINVTQAMHLLAQGTRPVILVGHSAGQYAALVVAGALEFAEAVRIAGYRGKLMQSAVPDGEGAMAAVSGLDLAEVVAACREHRRLGVVDVACDNAPGRTVISGTAPAVRDTASACQAKGGITAALPVSVPFHCELLAGIQGEFARALREVRFSTPRIRVIDNVTARALSDENDIRARLAEHVVARVRFRESVERLAAAGIQEVIQCGPGRSLIKMITKTCPALQVFSFGEYAHHSSADLVGGH